MTVQPVPEFGGSQPLDPSVTPQAHCREEHPEVRPLTPTVKVDERLDSFVELVNRTLADSGRTANAAAIVRTMSKSVARVTLSLGLVLAMIVVLASALIHFANLGTTLGSVIVAGGTTAVVGARYARYRGLGKRLASLDKGVSRSRGTIG